MSKGYLFALACAAALSLQPAFAEPDQCRAVVAAMRNQALTIVGFQNVRTGFSRLRISKLGNAKKPPETWKALTRSFDEAGTVYNAETVNEGIDALTVLCPESVAQR